MERYDRALGGGGTYDRCWARADTGQARMGTVGPQTIPLLVDWGHESPWPPEYSAPNPAPLM